MRPVQGEPSTRADLSGVAELSPPGTSRSGTPQLPTSQLPPHQPPTRPSATRPSATPQLATPRLSTSPPGAEAAGYRPETLRAQRRVLALLAVATAVGSLGLASGGTAGGLLATELTGSTASAGLPIGVLVAGSAAGALAISARAGHGGRGAGLALGYAVGAAGALVVIAAAATGSFALLLLGSAALGAASAAVFLTRYAAAEVGGPGARGRALGVVLFAASLGAVASPNLMGPSGELATALGLPPLTGLYVVAVPSFAAAGLMLAALARSGAFRPTSPASSATHGVSTRAARRQVTRQVAATLGTPRVRIALLVLGATNLVMVGVMAIAPVHLIAHGHSLGFVGLVVSVHVTAMFVPSPLTGWLADRAGSAAVAALGAAILIGTGVTGILAGADSGVSASVVLGLLGLGWNAGVVGGSTMLAAAAPAALRARVEGIGEVAMGLAAATGAPMAGLVTAAGGFTALSILAASVATLALASVTVPRPQGAARAAR